MSYINREFFEIAEETRRRETAVTLETHEYIATYFLSSFFLAFELSWITSDQRVVGLGLYQSIGSGDNRTNVALEFRIRCLWMLGE